MCGWEAAHYASTNKPSWITLLCSCLWMQADWASFRKTCDSIPERNLSKYPDIKHHQTNISSIIWLIHEQERVIELQGGERPEMDEDSLLLGLHRKLLWLWEVWCVWTGIEEKNNQWVLRLSLPFSWQRDQNPVVSIDNTRTWGSSANSCLKCSLHK